MLMLSFWYGCVGTVLIEGLCFRHHNTCTGIYFKEFEFYSWRMLYLQMEMEWNLDSFFIDNLDLSMLVWEVTGVIDTTETEFQFQTYLSMECPMCWKPYGWFLLNDWTRGLEILKFLGVQKQLASIFKIWTVYILVKWTLSYLFWIEKERWVGKVDGKSNLAYSIQQLVRKIN